MPIDITLPPDWEPNEYALLDSGDQFKLERFGGKILARPEPQAIWQRHLPQSEWDRADATFSREPDANDTAGKGAHWTARKGFPDAWEVRWRDFTFVARLSPFKHTGIFPEQAAHWEWLRQRIAASDGRAVRVLNLFGYTGIASLVAAHAGAQVTHVDASDKVIAWARENQAASGLQDAPIRWITDDALKFVRREARRASFYDLIIMDPPAFGRGAQGQVWKFETSLPELLRDCRAILTERPLGVLVNSYSIRASALALGNLLDEMLEGHRARGAVTVGELALPEMGSDRLLGAAIYARWASA